MEWLSRLNEIKKNSGKTTDEISNLSGIPKGTLNKLFAGQTKDPQLSTIKSVVHCLGYTLDDLTEIENDGKYNFYIESNEERDHIAKYRTLDQHGKEAVDWTINHEYARCTTPPPLELHEEPAEYNTSNILRIPLPDNRASAGFGDDLDNNHVTMIKAIANRDTIRADFAVRVDGHSMEPLYRDGDLVLVHRQPAVDVGDIGVFVANDKGYIKRQGEDRLISVNPDYPSVEPVDYYAYKCFGEVIGVLEPEWIVR